MIEGLIAPQQRQTYSEDVYEQLKDLLMSGKIMPGQHLTLRSLAAAFNISVMPVREAVQRLVAEKALEFCPNRVIQVTALTVDQFREITRIRSQLEGFAVTVACERMDADSLRKIAAHSESFNAELEKSEPDSGRLIATNKDLHFSIYECTGMPMLVELIESLWLRIGPILNYDLRSGSKRLEINVIVDNHVRMVKSRSCHNRLVEALKNRQPEAARTALVEDITDAAEQIIASGTLVKAA